MNDASCDRGREHGHKARCRQSLAAWRRSALRQCPGCHVAVADRETFRFTPGAIFFAFRKNSSIDRTLLTLLDDDEEVRSVPADPQETMIGQRPGVVRVPTFHVHVTRLPRFGYSPAAEEGPLL
jgi:hypothetical protein